MKIMIKAKKGRIKIETFKFVVDVRVECDNTAHKDMV